MGLLKGIGRSNTIFINGKAMQLDRIDIHNFRSIKDVTLRFDNKGLILLGKNEAGKSNILKAIAAVFGEYKVSDKDKRKKINNEKIDSYYVLAVFKLTKEEIKRVSDMYSKENKVIFGKAVSIQDFVEQNFQEFLMRVHIGNSNKPSPAYWSFNEKEYDIIEGPNMKSLISGVLKVVEGLYEENPFKCHYWQYRDSFLLPSSVSIPSFIADPNTCKGLQNLFLLCDRENIKSEFNNALSQDEDYIELLSQVSESVTTIFRSIWKDFKDTSIELTQNGDSIAIKVKDKVRYSFEDRSDGFKHFVSILLMLSAPSRKNKISDHDIILIDEPDNSLYPTSARYLRDELLKISEKSFVIYATHSQYMIDPDCIDRHLIVEKKNDITSIRQPEDKSCYSEDELLRNAIGTSIFECIRPHNLIFEGWLDKKLFETFIASDRKRSSLFKEYGKVYLDGISGAKTLCQLLILADRKFIIIADSDDTSVSKKKDFCKAYPDYKDCWKGYADVIPNISTVEDFLKPEYIERYLSNYYDSEFKYDSSKTAIQNIERVSKDKDTKQKIKAELITSAVKEDIRKEYDAFLDEIAKY